MKKVLEFLLDFGGWISALLLLLVFLLAMLLAAQRMAAQTPAGPIVQVGYKKEFCRTEKDITSCTHADILFQGISVAEADRPSVSLPIAGPVIHPEGGGWEIHYHADLCKPVPDQPYFRCYAVWFRKVKQ